jgi:hypothetical protein
MLQRRHEARFTMAQMIDHAWIAGERPPRDSPSAPGKTVAHAQRPGDAGSDGGRGVVQDIDTP